MKIDPYKHKERYIKWKKKAKEKGMFRISKYDSDLLFQYTEDMENGINVASSSVKGPRSYIRLNTIVQKMRFFSLKFKECYDLDKITDVSEEQLCKFFTNMKKGVIKKKDGGEYKSTAYFVSVFKAFWHWWMKINRKKGIDIKEITLDLDTRASKPKWVYLSEEQIQKLCDHALHKYKVLIMFLFDTGIRSPTELVNIRVSDFYNDFRELQIRDEISKTFGRKIKLMLCSDLIKKYVKDKNLGNEDYVFPINPQSVNKYLKRLALRTLGSEKSLAGQRYNELTLYDFRHCSCCYWLPRYKSESALKFRFGWKKSDKIHYYSEMIGMRDTITEEDLLIDTTKTEIEQKQERLKRENELLREKIGSMEDQMNQILQLVQKGAIILEK